MELTEKDFKKMVERNKATHSHSEAFCLMIYYCKELDETEVLWNSRDGVTPFVIGNKAGTNMMQHVDWEKDVYRPDYVPEIDSRIFVDLTYEMALEIAHINVERWWDDSELSMRHHDYLGPLGKEDAAKSLADDMMKPAGQPTVIIVTHEVQQEFSNREDE